ncbi:Ig-like domain-containing protein [Pedobacter foliorum]|uniref:Ig-like domain-containing protein n=1 Tax=Pedobacter foliorum TaxID=2739058 RepID=UPI0015665B06|nr:Ig-like domain-containing protein [Pedobacter foliorum]NRF40464.1 Ig-like domain-containing protein [Pedobacter foliorum]
MKKQLLALLALAMILTSCSKKDPEPKYSLDQTALELNYDKKHQFVIKLGSKDIEESEFKWSLSDETVGFVSASGLFNAYRIGKTTIKAVGANVTLTSVVTIAPYSTLCAEPYIKYGATKSTVKSKETRTLQDETATALYYRGENAKIKNALYGFDNNLLQSMVLVFADTEAVVKESIKFFSERYTYLGIEDDLYLFGNVDTFIGMGYFEKLGFCAIYLENKTGETGNLQAAKSAVQKGKANLVLQSKR